MYDIKTGEITDSEAMKQKMGIAPRQIIDCLALEGDAIDNVPGVPLIGEKTARELIRQYGDLDNLYAHADEIKGKRGENLRNSKEQAYVSRGLVTLDCNVPVEIDYKALALKEPDKERLTEIYTGLGFNRLLGQLERQERAGEGRTPVPAVGSAGRSRPAGPSLPARDLSQRSSAATLAHTYTLVDTPEKFAAFVAELREQKLISVDTETTSAQRHAGRAGRSELLLGAGQGVLPGRPRAARVAASGY